MAARKFLVSIDLNQNELLRGVLQNAATAPNTPTPVAGQLYYNTSDNKPYYYNGSSWIDFYGGIEEITADAGLRFTSGSGTDSTVNLSVDVDDASLYTDPAGVGGVLKIKPGGVLTTHIADLNVTTEKINSNAVTFAKMQDIATMTVIGRVSSGSGDPEEITIVTTINNDDNTVLATEGAIFRYVNEQITGLGELIGGWDASGGSWPTTGSGTAGAISKGDYWYITGAGTMGAVVVNVGDVIYAKQAVPGQTDANWFVVESNRDQATESTLGVAKLATNAEALAGTNDTNIITPLKLQAKLENWYASNGTSISAFTITGNDVATSFALNHLFNTRDVEVELYSNTSPYETVEAAYERTSTDSVTIFFNTAPATGENYRAVIVGRDLTL